MSNAHTSRPASYTNNTLRIGTRCVMMPSAYSWTGESYDCAGECACTICEPGTHWAVVSLGEDVGIARVDRHDGSWDASEADYWVPSTRLAAA